MKIAFVWWFDKANDVYDNWHDGLRAAIDVIGVDNDVDLYVGKYLPEGEYDFILFWDDSNSEFFQHLDKYNCRKGIILTTDPHNIENLRKLDVVFCESEPIYQAVRAQGLRAIKAFGTDTDFFSPTSVKKDIPFFYPATFSPWKRQSSIAHLTGLHCVGTVQPDGEEELQACKDNGVKVEIGYFPAEKIRDYYRRAVDVPIPAIHGSERTCLEAMSMDILPKVNPNNVRTYSYVKEFVESRMRSPREFVLKNYSHRKYAEDLMKGIRG